MEEEKVVLDRSSFEALSVDTRIKVLKSLLVRRKTLSEISEEQSMSVSGIKEHLQILENAQLVRKIDDGHKWKYYELTKKGREVVGPKELKVWIMLSISIVCLMVSSFFIFGSSMTTSEIPLTKSQPLPAPSPPDYPSSPNVAASAITSSSSEPSSQDNLSAQAPMPLQAPLPEVSRTAADSTPPSASNSLESIPNNFALLCVALISSLTLLSCVLILLNNRYRFVK